MPVIYNRKHRMRKTLQRRTNNVSLPSSAQSNIGPSSTGGNTSSSPTAASNSTTPSLEDNLNMNENTQQDAKWVIEYERMGSKDQLLYV